MVYWIKYARIYSIIQCRAIKPMEKKQIGMIMVKGMPSAYLSSHSAEFPILNSMISKGNVTKLVRRRGADFLTSIFGLARAEATKAPVEQTNLEDLYYNVNINSDFKQLFKGMSPFVFTNDSQSAELFAKYKIAHKLAEVSPKLLDSPETQDHNPLIVHINCESMADNLDPVCILLGDLIQYFSSASRLYTILYPFKSSLANIVPAEISPYISIVRPEQTYGFYKSGKVEDIEEEEVGVVVEEGESCRRDRMESFGDVFSGKTPGGLWMLAEQFMRQIAFYLGYIGKFGA
eukprot:TRINITY_DN2090_c0_g1_i8.p1 TRINITY_DN2090_c0_g1~~TRINITY_DN2090_c0_g1_i8.p1  ORF type:complete len:290 (-),score=70.23 TRINITY_DN2090_c0_g1_i8:1063-1932(-)